MLAVIVIQLSFDVHLQQEPTPVPVFDGVFAAGATGTMFKGRRQPDVKVLFESTSRFRAPPIEAFNHLQLTFRADDFDRSDDEPVDPSHARIQTAASDFLRRLAFHTEIPEIAKLDLDRCAWKLDYLNDDGSALLPEDGKCRGRESMLISPVASVFGGANFWTDFSKLPANFAPPLWHVLLNQARSTLPHVGGAVMMATIALEVYIELSISERSGSTPVPTDLWDWINTRNGGKGPSTADQFSLFLKLLCGRSLKEDNRLWPALLQIIEARNSFVHCGVTAIKGKAVDLAQASLLVSNAQEIMHTVEGWFGSQPAPTTA